jgi:hypothetical protein
MTGKDRPIFQMMLVSCGLQNGEMSIVMEQGVLTRSFVLTIAAVCNIMILLYQGVKEVTA